MVGGETLSRCRPVRGSPLSSHRRQFHPEVNLGAPTGVRIPAPFGVTPGGAHTLNEKEDQWLNEYDCLSLICWRPTPAS